jgi:hypothetical protein
MSDQYAIDVIGDQRIKVSKFDDLNDPFELHAIDLSDNQYREKFTSFKNDMAEHIGLLCFSKSWKSPLLWSHYANRHKGIALEFEVPNHVAHPIKYRRKRYILDIEMIRKRQNGFDREQIEAIWMTKYVQWKYEDEVRILLRQSEFYKDKDLYFYGLGNEIHLTGAVLGPLCVITPVEIENRLPNGLQISVTKTRLAFRSFEVVRNGAFKTVNVLGKGVVDQILIGDRT